MIFLFLLLLSSCRPKEPLSIEALAIAQDEEKDDVPVIVQEEQVIDTIVESEETDVTYVPTQEEQEEEGFFSSLFEAFTNTMEEIAEEQAKNEADEKEDSEQIEEEQEVEKGQESTTTAEQKEVTTESVKETITCSSNTYNCNNFKDWNEANNVYEECGGLGNDIHTFNTH